MVMALEEITFINGFIGREQLIHYQTTEPIIHDVRIVISAQGGDRFGE